MEQQAKREIDTSVAADILDVHPETLRNWCKYGILPPNIGWKMVGRYRFDRDALIEWRDSHRPEPQAVEQAQFAF